MVCSLLTGDLDLEDFCDADIESEGGKQVQEVVRRINRRSGRLSQGYKRFLANVCKETSVAGLLQVTGKEALKVLKRFAQQDLDLSKISNSASLRLLKDEVPPFLEMLEEIRF